MSVEIEYDLLAGETTTPEAPEPTTPTTGTVWGERDANGRLVTIPVGDLDVRTTALQRLWKQFENDPDWRALFGTVYGETLQEVEDLLAEVDVGRRVATAVGRQLEEIGDLVGQARGSLVDDDDYRLAIIAKAVSLLSSGTIPEIVDVVLRLGGETAVHVMVLPPEVLHIRFRDVSAARFALFADILADVAHAGASVWLSTIDSDLSGGPAYGGVQTGAGVFTYDGAPARSRWGYGTNL